MWISVYAVLVNVMDKAIQDNKNYCLFLEKDSEVNRFHWRNQLFKNFILKYVKSVIYVYIYI